MAAKPTLAEFFATAAKPVNALAVEPIDHMHKPVSPGTTVRRANGAVLIVGMPDGSYEALRLTRDQLRSLTDQASIAYAETTLS